MSAAALLSPQWYRVAAIRPRLKDGVRIARQQLRGQTWFVLSDPISGRHHRFNAAAYALVASCDGQRTIDLIWAQRVDAAGDDAPTQAQAIEVFAQAFGANLLAGDVVPDAAAAMRLKARRRTQRRRAAVNPLAFKLPLLDPDRWLAAHLCRVAWLFTPAARWAVLALVLAGALLLGWNFGEVSHELSSRLGQGRLLLLLWIAYPFVKALHELAHAFAVKACGGEVHEVGITLLMLTPVPYVDASASIAFESKHERIAVGAAGIAVEALLASAALLLWLLVEPGLLRDAALAVVFIGAFSSVAVNGNPLLRFDGYHVLCDALELPNLGSRSARCWQAIGKRLLLGRHAAVAPAAHGAERAWLIAYAPASWLWRCVLTFALALALVDWNAWVGLALLGLSLWWMLVGPLVAALRWLFASGELVGRRPRALLLGGAALAAMLLAALTVPLPNRTLAPGVVTLPDEALVRPGSEGFIDRILVRDGASVAAGTPLLRLVNEPLRVELARTEAQLRQEQVQQLAAIDSDTLRAAQAADRMLALGAERDRLAARVAALEVRAGVAGRVALDPKRLVPGRHLEQGQVVAQVLPPDPPLVRVLVANDDIAQVRAMPGRIGVELASAGGDTVLAQWLRSVPRASTELSLPALGPEAGGPLELDTSVHDRRLLLEPRFEVELRLPAGVPAPVGARAWVRFEHGSATLVELSQRYLRRTFLRHLAR